MFKLLIVEDQEDFYQDYLSRFFEEILPMDKIEITHAPTIKTALAALVEPWDMILMDYSMGPKVTFEDAIIRDGVDLITFRRGVEQQRELESSHILGTSSNQVGNSLMRDNGANDVVPKLDVKNMAYNVKGVLAIHERA